MRHLPTRGDTAECEVFPAESAGEGARIVRAHTLRGGLRLLEKRYPAGLRMDRHAHAEWRYCLLLYGTYTDSWRRGARTRTPHQLSLHPESETHTSTFHTPATCFHVEYGGDWRARLLRDAGIAPEPHEFLGGFVPSLAARMRDELLRDDACSPLVLEGLAWELAGWSARALRDARAGAHAAWVYQARDLLRDRFAAPLTLADIAAAVGAHPVRLAREFRRAFGCSIGEFVRRARVDYACRALRSTAPLGEIAQRAGFADQSHFSRVFKRATGLTPGAYRRRS